MSKPVGGRLHFAGREGLIGYLSGRRKEGTLFVVELQRFSEYAIVLDEKDLRRLLEELWQTFEAYLQQRAQVVRIDTSQFAIIWSQVLNPGQAALAATRILEQLRHLAFCRNAALQIRPRLGIASGCGGQEASREWVLHAYLALTQTEREPRFAIFEPDMEDALLRRWSLRQALARALEEQEFELCYQPRIELSDGRCSGVEALIRWEHPDFGRVGPDQFIPLLEESGAIVETTQWVLHRSSRELGSWLGEDTRRSFSFNVSTRALADSEFAEALKHAVGLWTLDPRQLVLEVTETAVWDDREPSIRALQDLRSRGIQVAIDDFGTGHATLEYLRQLPADEIKIDRTFVVDMLDRGDDAYLVQVVIDLGKRLGLKVIAEGAEELEQLRRLRDMGCDCAQGYAVARPMPQAELLAWSRANPNFRLD